MRILVFIKCVPAVSFRPSLDAGSLRLVRESLVLNGPDLSALETALRIRETTAGGAEVVVVSMAGEAAASPLRDAFAFGADRCVLVTDDRLAGSDLLVTGRVIAAVAAREEPQLLLFGQEAVDGNGAMLWAAVAERLRRPLISRARRVELVGAAIRAEREIAGGGAVVEAPTPCVVSVTSAPGEVRYASLKNVVAARAKNVDRLDAAELGLDASLLGVEGSQTDVLSVGRLQSARTATIVDDCEKGAELVVGLLASEGVL